MTSNKSHLHPALLIWYTVKGHQISCANNTFVIVLPKLNVIKKIIQTPKLRDILQNVTFQNVKVMKDRERLRNCTTLGPGRHASVLSVMGL